MRLRSVSNAKGYTNPESANTLISAFADTRQELGRKVGRQNLSLKTLMSDMKMMKALAKYMARTSRLKRSNNVYHTLSINY